MFASTPEPLVHCNRRAKTQARAMDQPNPLPTCEEDIQGDRSPQTIRDIQPLQWRSPLPLTVLAHQQGPALVFKAVHTALTLQQCVLSAWGETATALLGACPKDFETVHSPQSPHATTNTYSCEVPTNLCALTGSELAAAPVTLTANDTFVPDACPLPMEPKTARTLRHLHPIMPYDSSALEAKLRSFNLLVKYPNFLWGLQHSFHLNIPHIYATQTPPNSPSSNVFHSAFQTILSHELSTGCYIGPFSHQELQSLLSPFQSSPISIIPKPGKPGKFHVIQNFSFPHTVSAEYPNPSINSSINSDDFPCTWGTFDTICTIIQSLPLESQAATHNIADAYRTVPLHHLQWPAAVVHLPGGGFFADTWISFGMGPSAGVYEHMADTGIDILCTEGLGPIIKWVNDHLLFCVWCEHLERYNGS